MHAKENKGGFLSNEQVEKDQKAKGIAEGAHPYRGTQDTGDFMPRTEGTETQKQDGFTPEDENDTGRA